MMDDESFDLDLTDTTNPVAQAMRLAEPSVGELLGRSETKGDKVVLICDATFPELREEGVLVSDGFSFHVAIVDRGSAHAMARVIFPRDVIETLSRQAPPGLHHVVAYVRGHVAITMARRTDSPSA